MKIYTTVPSAPCHCFDLLFSSLNYFVTSVTALLILNNCIHFHSVVLFLGNVRKGRNIYCPCIINMFNYNEKDNEE